MPESSPQPGWYADPSGEHAWRWWNGQAWTTHTSTVSGYVSTAVRSTQLAAEMRIARLASLAPVVWVFVSFVSIIAEWQLGGQISRELHWFRQVIDLDQSAGGTVSLGSLPSPPPLAIAAWVWLEAPFGIASEVVLMVWQYRSAKVALSLGYPARVSPGLGVASWFIPILQLFQPYRAVRALLPQAHQARRLVPYWWSSLIASTLLLSALPFLVALSRPVGAVDVVLLVFVNAAVGFFARGIVVAVVADHRTAAETPPAAG